MTRPDHQEWHVAGPGPRVLLVPDLGEGLAHAVGELERLLLILRSAEERGAVLPGPLAGGAALTALRRVWRVVAPTQGRRAVESRLAGRLYAPGGRTEHVPLRLIDIDPVDVATLSAAAAALGAGSAGTGAVREALESGRTGSSGKGSSGAGPSGGKSSGKRLSGAELIAAAAGFSGLLDLADTAESILLRERLAAAGPGADVVLTPPEEAAYQVTMDRLNAMWPPASSGE